MLIEDPNKLNFINYTIFWVNTKFINNNKNGDMTIIKIRSYNHEWTKNYKEQTWYIKVNFKVSLAKSLEKNG